MALSPVLQLVLFVLCVLQVVIGMREDSLVPRLSVGGERESLGTRLERGVIMRLVWTSEPSARKDLGNNLPRNCLEYLYLLSVLMR